MARRWAHDGVPSEIAFWGKHSARQKMETSFLVWVTWRISVALDWSAEGTRPQPMVTEINCNLAPSLIVYFGLRLKVPTHAPEHVENVGRLLIDCQLGELCSTHLEQFIGRAGEPLLTQLISSDLQRAEVGDTGFIRSGFISTK